jgi:PDZ domain-containing secreted protein
MAVNEDPQGAGAPIPTAETVPDPHQTTATDSTADTPRKRRWWPWILFLALAAAVAICARVNLNYYAIQPGTAQSVQQFITVPKDKAHPVAHPVLLTDVLEGQVTVLNYLFFKLQSNTDLYSASSVTGGTAPSELQAQGNLEMSQAESSAKAAALTHLGYKVPAIPSGAVITGTFAGTPAYSTLNVSDVITAVDGVTTLDLEAMQQQLARHHSGQTVTLSVRRQGTGKPVAVPVTLKRTVVDLGGGDTATVDLGITAEDQIDYVYPFPVDIDVTNIGGPSAGLAMTLGVIDALDGGSLTGGHTVAATGTMAANGAIGPIGGIPQKTIAVENAGASIFLVPLANYNGAKRKDRPGLTIYPVTTLDQALAILTAHGGSVRGTLATASSHHPG